MNPEPSDLSPPENASTEYSVPAVPPLVEFVQRNAPPTVTLALIENTALDAELLTDWPDTAPSTSDCRVPSVQAVTSDRLTWEASVSPAAG